MATEDDSLGSLTEDQYGSLSKGFEMSNPIGSLGGFGVTKDQAVSYGLGLAGLGNTPVGAFNTAIGAIDRYSAEKAAQSALGMNRGLLDTVTGMAFNSAMGKARGMADTDKDGKVSTREAQNFAMQQGMMTSYEVGRNPMSGYTPNSVSIQGLASFGRSTPTSGVVNAMEAPSSNVDQFGFSLSPNVYSKAQAEAIGQGISQGVTGLGGGKGASYSGITNFSPTPGVDASGQSGQQSGAQTSHSGQGISFADDAASSDSNDGTYICTALYEMGDMKKYIYKYDQIYGKRVDPNVYRGYCVWGRYVATKLRNRGIVYKIAKPLALGWARQMAFDLSKGKHGNNNKVVKVISRIGESVCYALGVIANIKLKKGVRYG